MKILFVTHYFPPDSGAAAVRLSHLAHIVQSKGHTVTVLTTIPHYPEGRIRLGYKGRVLVNENIGGVQVIRAWLWATASPKISRRLMSQLSFMIFGLLRGVFISKPDVVFIEAQPMFTGLVGRILSRLKRVPYVLNVSDLWPDHLLSVEALSEDDFTYRLARNIVDAGYRGADAIVTLSPEWSRRISEVIGSTEKVHTVLRGTDLQQFRPGRDASTFRAKHGLENKRLVTFIGTLATQYDFATLLDAFTQVKLNSEVVFLMIGIGSRRASLQERFKKLGEQFRWIEWLPHDEIPLAWSASYITAWAMHDADLYRGTIPAKLYEAFASGTPVVAAVKGEAEQVIQESGGGICVPPEDLESLVSGVEQLLRDEQLRSTMSENARKYAETHFDAVKTAGMYETILLDVINKGQ